MRLTIIAVALASFSIAFSAACFLKTEDEIHAVPEESSNVFSQPYFYNQYRLIMDKVDEKENTHNMSLDIEIRALKAEYNKRAEGIDPGIFEMYDLPSKW